MATVLATHEWIAKGVLRSIWSGMGNGDVGSPLDAPHLPDKTVYIEGLPGAAGTSTCSILGANLATSAGIVVVDPQGNAITKTTPGQETILDNPGYLWPTVSTATNGITVNVIMVSRADPR